MDKVDFKPQIIECGSIWVKIDPNHVPQISVDKGDTWKALEWGDPQITVDVKLWSQARVYTNHN